MTERTVRRISPDDADTIVAMRADGYSLGAIAAHLDLSRSTVQRFCESRHVPVPTVVTKTRDNRPVVGTATRPRGITEARARRLVAQIAAQFGPETVAGWLSELVTDAPPDSTGQMK